jgi:hypothetical protein
MSCGVYPLRWRAVSDAFYVPDADGFLPTEWTRGPWDPGAQHAGPPAALVARAVQALDPELQVARFTMEVLRPVPLTRQRVEAELVRSGRRVSFARARLADDAGDIALAGAWLIRPAQDPQREVNLEPADLPGPDDSTGPFAFDPWNGPSYFSAMDWRFARGVFFEPGPAAAWMRMKVQLVEGEEPSPLTRVLVAADSGNGISTELPIDEFLFINTELSVHLARMPEGEWVCLDAVTRIGERGVGLAESVLWDRRGRFGRGSQSLLVAPR